MENVVPALDSDAEASHISVQAAPGALFLRLRREHAGTVRRRMFVELTVREAMVLRRELDECISIAAIASEF